MGEICVMFHQGKSGGEKTANAAHHRFAGAGAVHEKALKGRAISQLTRFDVSKHFLATS